MKKVPLAIAVALLATACAGAPNTGFRPGHALSVRGDVRVAARPTYRLKGTSALRVPFELRRLDHIEVWVRNKDDGDDPFHLLGTLPFHGESDVDHTFDPVLLANLKPYRHYVAQLKAFQFDPAANDIVQVDQNDDHQSETEFDTFDGSLALTEAATEQIVLPSGFALSLRNQEFNGQASGSIVAIDGVLHGPTDPVTLLLPPGPPHVHQIIPFNIGYPTWGIGFDAVGNAVLAQSGGSFAVRVSPSGEVLQSIFTSVSGRNLAVDSAFNIWFGNAAGGSTHVSRTDPDGTNLVAINAGSVPVDVALNRNTGEIWATNAGDDTVTRFDVAGNPIATSASGVDHPVDGIDFDVAGYAWVGGIDSHSVAKLTRTGAFSFSRPVAGANSYPEFLAVDPNNNVWVCDETDNVIVRYSPGGVSLGDIALESRPNGICFDQLGHAWVALVDIGKVAELAPDGTLLGTFNTGVNPRRVATAPYGDVWVSDSAANNVFRIMP